MGTSKNEEPNEKFLKREMHRPEARQASHGTICPKERLPIEHNTTRKSSFDCNYLRASYKKIDYPKAPFAPN
jgi:hypothetical protein